MKEHKQDGKIFHPSQMVRAGDFFVNAFKFFESTRYQSFSDKIHEPKQVIKKDDIPYRVLSHWDSQDLIECERNNEKGWRKFSLVSSLWLFMVKELRQYGISIETIKKIKKCFFNTKTGKIFPILEFYLAFGIMVGRPLYWVVFSNGHAECFDYNQYKVALSLELLETHLVININEQLLKLNLPKSSSVNYSYEEALNKEYDELADMIKNIDFKSFTIHKVDGVIDRTEIKTTADSKAKIVDLLASGDNIDILIKKRHGNVLYTSTTNIEKVK